jgi:hypothetical protein
MIIQVLVSNLLELFDHVAIVIITATSCFDENLDFLNDLFNFSNAHLSIIVRSVNRANNLIGSGFALISSYLGVLAFLIKLHDCF